MNRADAIGRAADELAALSAMLGGLSAPGRPEGAGRVSVTILSGFLGAGKTTLLRRLLSRAEQGNFGVIVNDFGTVNLDAEAVLDQAGEVISLANGCSCCAMGVDLTAALARLVNVAHPPDHIFVEASGLSDPAALATLADLALYPGASAVVTVVDCANSHATRTQHAAARMWKRQIETAHLLVLTKLDTAAAIPDELATLAQGRMVVRADDRGKVEDLILERKIGGARPSPAEQTHELTGFASVTLAAPHPVSPDQLQALLDRLPAGLLRLKGHVMADDGRHLEVQATTSQWTVSAPEAPGGQPQLVAIWTDRDNRARNEWLRDLRGLLWHAAAE